MAVSIQSQVFNPISGVFGTGQVQIFGLNSLSNVWTVPLGINKVRARCFGGAGGFAMKSIYDLTGVTSVPITVQKGTCSFGSYVSATGGYGGIGIGGDINCGSLNGSAANLMGATTFSSTNYPSSFSIDFFNASAASWPGVEGAVVVEW